MAETKTEQLAREIKEKKATKGPSNPKTNKKAMGAGVPYFVAGLVWACLALITPIYKLWVIICVSIVAFLVGLVINLFRKHQLKRIPQPAVKKTFNDEIASKLYVLRDLVIDRAKLVKNSEMKEHLGSIAVTLNKMAEDVEEHPEDRAKVRKLANYYGDMLLELVDKYINFENNIEGAPNGETIQTSMAKILDAVSGADKSLEQLFDDLFAVDAMEINADINTLDKLMRLELEENKKD